MPVWGLKSTTAKGSRTTTLCRNWLFPPVRDLWIWLQVYSVSVSFLDWDNYWEHHWRASLENVHRQSVPVTRVDSYHSIIMRQEFQQKKQIAYPLRGCDLTRDTKEGCPLLTTENEVNGDLKRLVPRAYHAGTRDFCSPWLLKSAQYKYFFPNRILVQFLLSPSPSKLGRQPCWVACPLVCVLPVPEFRSLRDLSCSLLIRHTSSSSPSSILHRTPFYLFVEFANAKCLFLIYTV